MPATAVSPGDFYRSGLLVPVEELGPTGEVIDHIAPSTAAPEVRVSVPRYGRIYVSHPGGEPPELGTRLFLFRTERRVKPYGRVIRPTGLATVAAVHEDVSTAVVIELYDRVLTGDQASIAETFQGSPPGVFAEPVTGGPNGELVAALDRQPALSAEDIVFVNVGRSQGVSVGDEFEIFIPSHESSGGLTLPEEHVAVGRVVRVTEATATLRLIEQRHAAIEVGLPVRLIRKMPS